MVLATLMGVSEPKLTSMNIGSVFSRGIGCLAISLAGLVNSARGDSIPYPNVGMPVEVGQKLIALGGEVTVQMSVISGAFFDNYLFLFSPPPEVAFDPGPPPVSFLFWNHGSPGTRSLGLFPAGTELIFGLHSGEMADTDNDPQTPDELIPLSTWYTGPGERNVDGFVHVYTVNSYGGDPNSTYVAFEDLNGGSDGTGSDWNYLDMEFIFTGATSIPEPATASLLGSGLVLLRALMQRSRRICAQWR